MLTSPAAPSSPQPSPTNGDSRQIPPGDLVAQLDQHSVHRDFASSVSRVLGLDTDDATGRRGLLCTPRARAWVLDRALAPRLPQDLQAHPGPRSPSAHTASPRSPAESA